MSKSLQELLREQREQLEATSLGYNRYRSGGSGGVVASRSEETPPSLGKAPEDVMIPVKKISEAPTKQHQQDCAPIDKISKVDSLKYVDTTHETIVKSRVPDALLPKDLVHHCSKFLIPDRKALWEKVSSKLVLNDKSWDAKDDGDDDYHTTSELLYDGQSIWKDHAIRSTNMRGTWGSQMSASLSADNTTLLVLTTNFDESIRWTGDASRISVLELLKKASPDCGLSQQEIAVLEGSTASKHVNNGPKPPKTKAADDDQIPAQRSSETLQKKNRDVAPAAFSTVTAEAPSPPPAAGDEEEAEEPRCPPTESTAPMPLSDSGDSVAEKGKETEDAVKAKDLSEAPRNGSTTVPVASTTRQTSTTEPSTKQQLTELLPPDLNDHCSKFLSKPKDAWKALVADNLRLENRSYGENDEGDYDYYTIYELKFKGTQIWRGSACRSSNIGGAWGSQLNASMSYDGLAVIARYTNVNESIGSSNNTRGEENRISVVNILKKPEYRHLLIEEEWAQLEGLDSTLSKDIKLPSRYSPEKGSTWQLHNDPWN